MFGNKENNFIFIRKVTVIGTFSIKLTNKLKLYWIFVTNWWILCCANLIISSNKYLGHGSRDFTVIKSVYWLVCRRHYKFHRMHAYTCGNFSLFLLLLLPIPNQRDGWMINISFFFVRNTLQEILYVLMQTAWITRDKLRKRTPCSLHRGIKLMYWRTASSKYT